MTRKPPLSVGYYVIARRNERWKRLLGPFDTHMEAFKARNRVTMPAPGDMADVERVARRGVLPVIGDMK